MGFTKGLCKAKQGSTISLIFDQEFKKTTAGQRICCSFGSFLNERSNFSPKVVFFLLHDGGALRTKSTRFNSFCERHKQRVSAECLFFFAVSADCFSEPEKWTSLISVHILLPIYVVKPT